jgi:hypothetical protein
MYFRIKVTIFFGTTQRGQCQLTLENNEKNNWKNSIPNTRIFENMGTQKVQL